MKHILLVLLICITSCSKETSDQVTIQGEAFGTTYAVTYFGTSNEAQNIQKGIDSVVYVVNKSMSTYMRNSDISKIN